MKSFHPRTGTELDAYQAGEKLGHERPGGVIDCPYDGRKRLGKAWRAGYFAGDSRRCAEARAREVLQRV